MNVIRAQEVRNLFLTKAGMPKKNDLLNLEQICEALGKPMPDENHVDRFYVRNTNLKVMRNIRKYFHAHHVMFIAPEVEGVVYYGFSTNSKHLDNYMERLHIKAKQHAIIENVAKNILNGQGELFGNSKQKMLGAS